MTAVTTDAAATRAELPRPRAPFAVALAIGVSLVLAPVVFQMFTRAPLGGQMLDEFRPFMDESVLADFSGYLDAMDAAHTELAAREPAEAELPATATFVAGWPEINDSMGGMLADIRDNVDNYRAVDALPPFPLFPWFFVLPGLFVAGIGAWGVRAAARGTGVRRPADGLIALGVALILAPAVFQMFTRAPQGGAMIEDLRPLMTSSKVSEMQANFLTLGAMEGEVRNRLLPELDGEAASALPDTVAFVETWPRISNEMAPMIGAMADNLDNFAAVDALPPFPLFPWFFVVPGVLLAGLGVAGRRTRDEAEEATA